MSSRSARTRNTGRRTYEGGSGYGYRTGRRGTGAARTSNRRYSSGYYYGTEAPDLYTRTYEQPSVRRRTTEDERYARSAALRNREKSRHMNPALIGSMLIVVAVIGVFLIQYLRLQATVTTAVQEVARLESAYTKLKQSNDEAQSEIDSSINLDEIKYKAITDLGMTYAGADQVVTYTNDDSDYVHQVTQIQH